MMDSALLGENAYLESELRKVDVAMYRQFDQYGAEMGMSVPDVAARKSQWLQSFGPSNDLKNILGQSLRGGDEGTILLLRSMGNSAGDVLKSADKALWNAVRVGDRGGIPAEQIIAKWAARQPTDTPMNRMLQDHHGLDSKGMASFRKDGVEASMAIASAEGMDLGEGFLPFDELDPGDADEVSPELSTRYEALAQLYSSLDPSLTKDEVALMANEQLAQEIEVQYINGDKRVVLSRTPAFVGTGEDYRRMPKPDGATMSAVVDHLTDNAESIGLAPKAAAGRAGRVGRAPPADTDGDLEDQPITVSSVRPDDLTARDGKFAVETDSGSGVSSPITLSPGEVFLVTEARRSSDMFFDFPAVDMPVDAPGMVAIQVPAGDTQERNRVGWTFDGENMRFRVAPREFEAEATAEQIDNLSVRPGPQGPKNFRGRFSGRKSHVKTSMLAAVPARVDPRGRKRLALTEPETVDEAIAEVAAVTRESDARGEFLLDLSSAGGREFMGSFLPFLEEHEGNYTFAYDDRTSKRVTKGVKVQGDPTIGIGFNLTRPDARQMIEAVGADFDKVLAGDEELDQNLYGHFKDNAADLKQHQWVALLSLAYNSRWDENGPTLIGPKITRAVRNGDLDAVLHEIRENSQGGVAASQLPGIRIRRSKEAAMFAGTPSLT
jgi:GH24 family phage-related lysozyme (muramidase)